MRHVGLNGIDISSWQEDLVVSARGTCNFTIVKATGGAGYSNECFRRHADETLAAGKLLGCYRYARDRGYEESAEAEADHFIDAFRPYVGKAIPFLDWEADALDLGTSWAKRWLERVKAKTGVTPGILKDFCWWVPDDPYDLGEELRRELPAGHPLECRNLVALARSERRDDVLFHDGRDYVLAHLTRSAHNALPFPLFEVVNGDISQLLRNNYFEEE